ncbi:nucleoside deaminase [Aquibacillus koreensis]|uniref:Nucleoside deaminase n=1 Tax=Aquibacillus koreensis TaxID=279446 RepID=A0A9X3WNW0_9BACI|nr:nucleoside deaminase [Aquibacillus koreensis]MCT2537006.1 nucleoside deaminase [Aquibacillus koreensis]MDC3422340.1 nucleoside deaminase [Aquibacillus koreensis]
MNNKLYLNQAIQLAVENVSNNGGPFGAVIINKQGEIIGRGQNRVTDCNDPTAHAEIQAIRQACENLQTFQLDTCTLYTSCEPCPMCLGAIYWARLEKVYYAADQNLAAASGFDDAFIYDEIAKHHEARSIPFHLLPLKEKVLPFKVWDQHTAKVEY